MTTFAIVNDNQVVRFGQLSQLFPNVSFPLSGPSDDWKVEHDVVAVIDRLDFDPATERLEPVEPYYQDGTALSVRVVPRDPQDIENERRNLIALAIASWNLEVISTLSSSEKDEFADQAKTAIRTQRNNELASCDWTQLSDAPVDSTAWAAYRQALRDISAQAGFPWEITWPEEPS